MNQKIVIKSNIIIVRPDGIVEFQHNPEWQEPDTVESARIIAEQLKAVVHGKHRAILCFPPNLYLKKEIVDVFREMDLGQLADAVVVNSFGARLIGNMALKLHKNPHPMKLFKDRAKAEAWLLEILHSTS